jgi:hypothetical protein
MFFFAHLLLSVFYSQLSAPAFLIHNNKGMKKKKLTNYSTNKTSSLMLSYVHRQTLVVDKSNEPLRNRYATPTKLKRF